MEITEDPSLTSVRDPQHLRGVGGNFGRGRSTSPGKKVRIYECPGAPPTFHKTRHLPPPLGSREGSSVGESSSVSPTLSSRHALRGPLLPTPFGLFCSSVTHRTCQSRLIGRRWSRIRSSSKPPASPPTSLSHVGFTSSSPSLPWSCLVSRGPCPS